MIFFVGDVEGLKMYLDSWGRPLARRVRMLSYDQIFRARRLRVGTYVFMNVDLLPRADAERTAIASASLAALGPVVRLLNHPLHSLGRYELLRTLKERGFNAFDVYSATEARWPARFPVFIREANDHTGPVTALLHSGDALATALDDLTANGKSREGKLIVEFCETADGHGIYRKYSAQIVGEHIVPVHIAFSRSWVTKGTRLDDEALLREEFEYVCSNPHEQALREIFALAHIEYGRIDYGLLEGAVQTWEINTNPFIIAAEFGAPGRRPSCEHVASRLNAALAAIDSPAPAQLRIPNPLRRRWVRGRQRRIVRAGLALLGLARHEPTVIAALSGCLAAVTRVLRGIRTASALLRRR